MITVPEEWGIWINWRIVLISCAWILNGGLLEETFAWMRGGGPDCTMNDFLPSTHLKQEEFPMPVEAGKDAGMEKKVLLRNQPSEDVGHAGRIGVGRDLGELST